MIYDRRNVRAIVRGKTPRIRVRETWPRCWAWEFRAGNGRVVARSGPESYAGRDAAEQAAVRVVSMLRGRFYVDLPEAGRLDSRRVFVTAAE